MLARWLIGFVGVMGVGGLLADCLVWATARQHMKNPAWPPHAKFHNAQTILLGIGLGVLTVALVTVPAADSAVSLDLGRLYCLSILAEHARCSCISRNGMGRP